MRNSLSQESGAPKARNIKARGKRVAKRSASPLVNDKKARRRPDRPKYSPPYYALFMAPSLFYDTIHGRRASRLRLAFIFRAVGAQAAMRNIPNV